VSKKSQNPKIEPKNQKIKPKKLLTGLTFLKNSAWLIEQKNFTVSISVSVWPFEIPLSTTKTYTFVKKK